MRLLFCAICLSVVTCNVRNLTEDSDETATTPMKLEGEEDHIRESDVPTVEGGQSETLDNSPEQDSDGRFERTTEMVGLTKKGIIAKSAERFQKKLKGATKSITAFRERVTEDNQKKELRRPFNITKREALAAGALVGVGATAAVATGLAVAALAR